MVQKKQKLFFQLQCA